MADSLDGTGSRRDLYRYLTFDHAPVYIRIMRILGGEVLSREMSSAELVAALAEEIDGIDEIFVEARMTQLVAWGNVIPGVRNQRVTTVAELLRAKGRYQSSKLGARVAREADDIIRAADGAREVARELLGVIAEQLAQLLTLLGSDDGPEPGEVAAAATSVFTNHQMFHGSLRDFYAYLIPVLSRYDLVGEEYHALKTVLIGYIDLIGAEDRRHSPRIFDTLTALEPRFDQVVELLADWQTLTDENTERAPRPHPWRMGGSPSLVQHRLRRVRSGVTETRDRPGTQTAAGQCEADHLKLWVRGVPPWRPNQARRSVRLHRSRRRAPAVRRQLRHVPVASPFARRLRSRTAGRIDVVVERAAS